MSYMLGDTNIALTGGGGIRPYFGIPIYTAPRTTTPVAPKPTTPIYTPRVPVATTPTITPRPPIPATKPVAVTPPISVLKPSLTPISTQAPIINVPSTALTPTIPVEGTTTAQEFPWWILAVGAAGLYFATRRKR